MFDHAFTLLTLKLKKKNSEKKKQLPDECLMQSGTVAGLDLLMYHLCETHYPGQ